MLTADIWDFFASPNIEKQANLHLRLNVQKLHPQAPDPAGLMSFAYCSINTVSLPYDRVYYF